MSRKEKLNDLLSKLEKNIFDIREELEDFLQEDNDTYTIELQNAISNKLDGIPFHFQTFDDFLNYYQKNNPTDPAGYHDLRSRIYGEQ